MIYKSFDIVILFYRFKQFLGLVYELHFTRWGHKINILVTKIPLQKKMTFSLKDLVSKFNRILRKMYILLNLLKNYFNY